MTVMITGGAGFIGSHICVELIHAGRKVVVYDNFCNSHPEVINRIRRITGTAPDVVKGDVRDVEHADIDPVGAWLQRCHSPCRTEVGCGFRQQVG
jgi:UDP-glucose 4-epimerase